MPHSAMKTPSVVRQVGDIALVTQSSIANSKVPRDAHLRVLCTRYGTLAYSLASSRIGPPFETEAPAIAALSRNFELYSYCLSIVQKELTAQF